MKIATLGPAGTFSHEATLKKYRKANITFANTIWDVFDTVTAGTCSMGIIPLENSISGSIGMTLDALMEFDLGIVGEIVLPINHHLAGHDGIKNIKTIYAHPATHDQCQRFIRKNFPGAEVISTTSNAASAEMLSKADKSKVAIVPEEAIRLYNLPVIKRNVADHKYNETKFIVVSKEGKAETGKDRTSIALHPKADKPGLLFHILKEFADRKINLTKIQSRPTKGKLGDYVFFIDVQGHCNEKKLIDTFENLQTLSDVRILGSYPRVF